MTEQELQNLQTQQLRHTAAQIDDAIDRTGTLQQALATEQQQRLADVQSLVRRIQGADTTEGETFPYDINFPIRSRQFGGYDYPFDDTRRARIVKDINAWLDSLCGAATEHPEATLDDTGTQVAQGLLRIHQDGGDLWVIHQANGTAQRAYSQIALNGALETIDGKEYLSTNNALASRMLYRTSHLGVWSAWQPYAAAPQHQHTQADIQGLAAALAGKATTAALTTEQQARIAADTTEQQQRQQADTALGTRIDGKADTRHTHHANSIEGLGDELRDRLSLTTTEQQTIASELSVNGTLRTQNVYIGGIKRLYDTGSVGWEPNANVASLRVSGTLETNSEIHTNGHSVNCGDINGQKLTCNTIQADTVTLNNKLTAGSLKINSDGTFTGTLRSNGDLKTKSVYPFAASDGNDPKGSAYKDDNYSLGKAGHNYKSVFAKEFRYGDDVLATHDGDNGWSLHLDNGDASHAVIRANEAYFDMTDSGERTSTSLQIGRITLTDTYNDTSTTISHEAISTPRLQVDTVDILAEITELAARVQQLEEAAATSTE